MAFADRLWGEELEAHKSRHIRRVRQWQSGIVIACLIVGWAGLLVAFAVAYLLLRP